MPEPNSLVSLGELSKPATVLIERISDAIGGIFRPQQIRRVAEAEADAEIITSKAKIKITDLQRRAMHRFLVEEAQKQWNIESIALKAVPGLAANASPENIEKDWIINFFDKSRLVSDDQMQELWARVLTGEANQPGFCSKRTVNLLASMDKTEAELFRSFCAFVWDIEGLVPLIFDLFNPIYNANGISFTTLQHLELIGLIKFDSSGAFQLSEMPEDITAKYFDRSFRLCLPALDKGCFPIGKVLLTGPGEELAPVSGSSSNPAFCDYALNKWERYRPSPA